MLGPFKFSIVLSLLLALTSGAALAGSPADSLSPEQFSYLLTTRQNEIAAQRAFIRNIRAQLEERKNSSHYLGTTFSLVITGFGVANIISPQKFGTIGEPELSIARFLGKVLAVGGTIGVVSESIVILSKTKDIERIEQEVATADKELEAKQIELNLLSAMRNH